MVQQEAGSFACLLGYRESKANPGWLSHLKERYRIVGKVLSSESSSVIQAEVGEWLLEKNVPEILGSNVLESIYNADESSLYKILPKRTLARKDETCHGGKQSKQRPTFLLCVNMDGSDKHDPLIIKKSVKTQCFKGLKTLSQNMQPSQSG